MTKDLTDELPQDLDRFVQAQARNYDAAEREISAGRKTSHWMWYVYPQLHGLGRSDFSLYYGLDGVREAQAYLAHPILGPRLVHMMELLLQHLDMPAEVILGRVDAGKLRSSATLFANLSGSHPVFAQVLDMFYDGERCAITEALMAADEDEAEQ